MSLFCLNFTPNILLIFLLNFIRNLVQIAVILFVHFGAKIPYQPKPLLTCFI